MNWKGNTFSANLSLHKKIPKSTQYSERKFFLKSQILKKVKVSQAMEVFK